MAWSRQERPGEAMPARSGQAKPERPDRRSGRDGEGLTPHVRVGPPRRPKWVGSIGAIDPCWAFGCLFVDFFSNRFSDVFSIALLIDVCTILV